MPWRNLTLIASIGVVLAVAQTVPQKSPPTAKPSIAKPSTAPPTNSVTKAPPRSAPQPATTMRPTKSVLPRRFAIKDILPTGATGAARMWLEGGSPVFRTEANGAAYSLQVQLMGSSIIATGRGSMFMEGCDPKDTPPCKESKVMLAGNEHVLRGKVQIGEWLLDSDPAYPLTFKAVASEGYVRLCGRGKVARRDQQPVRLGDGETVGTWLPGLQSPDQLEREGAAQAIGWLARAQEDVAAVLPALTKALADPAMEVRRNAAEALGRIGDPTAVAALRAAQEDSSAWVVQVAEEAAERILKNQPSSGATAKPSSSGPCLVIQVIQPGPPAGAKESGITVPGGLISGDALVKWVAADGLADQAVEMVSESAPAKCLLTMPTPGSIGALRFAAASGPTFGGEISPEDKTIAYRVIGSWEFGQMGPDLEQTIRVEGSKDDPLTFRLAKGIGLTYLKGAGKVVMPDGKSITLPCGK